MRYAIIETATGKIVNVVEYDTPPSVPLPGFGDGFSAIQTDSAGTDWAYSGGAFVAPAPPVAPARTGVLPQDLVAQFTTGDMGTIQTAISGDVQFLQLWYAMLAQKDPMQVTNARFLAGWKALIQVLGKDRMNAIAAALGVSIG